PHLNVPDYRVRAIDNALLVAHPIAAVVAADKYAARDAVDLISVEYEELPAVVDVEAAAKGGTVIHEKFGDNVAYKLTSGEGDIEAALKSADRVLSQRMDHQRLAPISMETRRAYFQSTIHGRAQVGTVEIGCKSDGTITGLRYNVFADLGAYHQLLTPAIPTLTGLMLSGAYKIPAIQMNVTGVFTNKMA